jgi:hypothetical protein
VIGGGLPLFVRSSETALHRLLSLAAGFFLGLVFLDLLPHVDFSGTNGPALWQWVLAGLLAVLVLDLGIFGKQSHAAVGWTTLIGLTVHAFSMGLGLGMLTTAPVALGWGLSIHKLGETFSLASALRFTIKDRRVVLGLIVGFSCVTPAGLLAGDALRETVTPHVAAVCTAIAAGSFLYVAVGDLLPEVFHNAEDRLPKLGMLLGGVAFAWLASEGHGEVHGNHVHLHTGTMTLALEAFWGFFARAAPYLLLGFLVATMVHAWLPRHWLQRAMGRNDFSSVAAAAVVGAPLPLCSCSVLPTAIGLRQAGASKAATVSLLVSTPETGPDSIAMTWALLDPVMTIVRPISAVTSALVAGIATILFGDDTAPTSNEAEAPCSDHSETPPEQEPSPGLRRSLRYAFVDVLDDIMPSLLIGTAIAAFLTVLLPADQHLLRWLAASPLGLFAAALIGAPIYVCASASTPIAAALMLKGLSPGAALVFLLVGPATNFGSLLVLRRELGTRVVTIYLVCVIATAIALGAVVDLIFSPADVTPRLAGDAAHLHENIGPVSLAAAILLGGLCLASLRRRMRTAASPV